MIGFNAGKCADKKPTGSVDLLPEVSLHKFTSLLLNTEIFLEVCFCTILETNTCTRVGSNQTFPLPLSGNCFKNDFEIFLPRASGLSQRRHRCNRIITYNYNNIDQ